jgi:chorismate synthase
MLRFLTAGESHGQALVAMLEGMPAGLAVDIEAVAAQLKRRQGGYGRGRRMAIESDRAQVLAGIRRGHTTGAPIALLIPNKDWQNWQKTMHVEPEMPESATGANRGAVTRPRPGHADLAGALKYDLTDIRDVLERASARETASRVAVGSIARQLLARFGIDVLSHVTMIGGVGIDESLAIPVERIRAIPADSPLNCADVEVERAMIAAIDAAKEAGDTLGGAFEVVVTGLPVGLGSYVQWDRKLDGRLAQAIMSIPAIKAVGIGKGPDVARLPGSRIHDEIVPAAVGGGSGHPSLAVARLTNNAGGLEGGVTNGEQLRITGYMKPIATLMKPLRSVDLTTLEESPAAIERSDVCAVTAAAVVGEAMVSLAVADAFLEKFTGDNLADIERVFDATCAHVRDRFRQAAETRSATTSA